MERGDIVRLKQPFNPEPNCSKTYRYGVVVGLVKTDGSGPQSWETTQLSEVILKLYEPETSTVYTDEFFTQPMFYFCIIELESIK